LPRLWRYTQIRRNQLSPWICIFKRHRRDLIKAWGIAPESSNRTETQALKARFSLSIASNIKERRFAWPIWSAVSNHRSLELLERRAQRSRGRECAPDDHFADFAARDLHSSFKRFGPCFSQERERARPDQRWQRGPKTNAAILDRRRILDSCLDAAVRFFAPFFNDRESARGIAPDFPGLHA
jgi:hypothetical protein